MQAKYFSFPASRGGRLTRFLSSSCRKNSISLFPDDKHNPSEAAAFVRPQKNPGPGSRSAIGIHVCGHPPRATNIRVKNIVDTIFFALRALCRGTAQSSADRIEETRFGLSPRAAALASGMVGKSETSKNPEIYYGFPGLKSDRRGSNSRPPPWQGGVLPTVLLSHMYIKNQML